MSGRYLMAGLVTEGESDELLLAPVILRQLRQLSLRGPEAFDVGEIVLSPVRTVHPGDRVEDEVRMLLGCCDVVIAHQDHRESGKVESLAARLGADRRRLVGIVPRWETEAWALCDPQAFQRIPACDLSRLPRKPHETEAIADPKAALRAVLRSRSATKVLDQLGRDIRLERLALIPAYQSWLDGLTKVLKELHFL
ncbi:hypothetical protein [Streptacidiphilus sp. P02-A3a]|uniref:hypothetical protein n=1 Tax=Streptacidiphilus sp. P02-A3a TaxID=2704468 RepID=UPI0015FBB4D4|nr:hypothetical protein [Streptacidiphilus sp. P02-A3a]QMU72405.1 DUF4276 family protein [Streptacidiphilus sp. P02-A3a]